MEQQPRVADEEAQARNRRFFRRPSVRFGLSALAVVLLGLGAYTAVVAQQSTVLLIAGMLLLVVAYLGDRITDVRAKHGETEVALTMIAKADRELAKVDKPDAQPEELASAVDQARQALADARHVHMVALFEGGHRQRWRNSTADEQERLMRDWKMRTMSVAEQERFLDERQLVHRLPESPEEEAAWESDHP